MPVCDSLMVLGKKYPVYYSRYWVRLEVNLFIFPSFKLYILGCSPIACSNFEFLYVKKRAPPTLVHLLPDIIKVILTLDARTPSDHISLHYRFLYHPLQMNQELITLYDAYFQSQFYTLPAYYILRPKATALSLCILTSIARLWFYYSFYMVSGYSYCQHTPSFHSGLIAFIGLLAFYWLPWTWFP